MQYNFEKGIGTFDAPPIVAVKFLTTEGWGYNIASHAVCISGKRADLEYFRIADSYITWVIEDANMFYTRTANAIYNAMSTRGIGYIY
ncbi:hypothetical protein DFR58_11830 [Anaerobacterium chartisolvens]|uniref:Uncharacterized protein n=2 Tax=Anaerobacterium chartisolvens TaxID=1297424 RepID=A0A369AV06_9FIRM|nr:hypothetical protein DFR58_11830 [Anaerobacterium chartisolvens]